MLLLVLLSVDDSGNSVRLQPIWRIPPFPVESQSVQPQSALLAIIRSVVGQHEKRHRSRANIQN
jgi:hypothetical protein